MIESTPTNLQTGSDYLTSHDGTRLFYQHWRAEDVTPRWLFVIVHGGGEHSGRYLNLINYFAPRGAVCYGFDLRGHGRSSGSRGHCMKMRELVDDVKAFVDRIKTTEAELIATGSIPVVLVGHSVGGAIAIAYTLAYPETITKALYSSPAFVVAAPVPAWKVFIGRTLSNIVPRLTLSNGVNSTVLSHDPAVVQAYRDDPLVHDQISARFYNEMFVVNPSACLADAGKIHVPFLLIHGEADPLISFQGSQDFFAATKSGQGTFKTYPGFYHESFNEIGKEQVFKDIEEWLEMRNQ